MMITYSMLKIALLLSCWLCSSSLAATAVTFTRSNPIGLQIGYAALAGERDKPPLVRFVVVKRKVRGGAAVGMAQIKPGLVLAHVNGLPMRNLSEITAALKARPVTINFEDRLQFQASELHRLLQKDPQHPLLLLRSLEHLNNHAPSTVAVWQQKAALCEKLWSSANCTGTLGSCRQVGQRCGFWRTECTYLCARSPAIISHLVAYIIDSSYLARAVSVFMWLFAVVRDAPLVRPRLRLRG